MTDNYQNFIYLFNDKGEAQVKTGEVFSSLQESVAAAALGGVFKQIAGGEVGYKLVGGTTKDFPPNKFQLLREDEVIIGTSNAPTIGDGKDISKKERVIQTNDPGNNPRDIHMFDIILDTDTNKGAKSYQFMKGSGGDWKFTVPGFVGPGIQSVSFDVAKPSVFDLFTYKNELPDISEISKLVQKDDSSYTYYQRVLYKASGFTGEKTGNAREYVKEQFSAYFKRMVGNLEEVEIRGTLHRFLVPYSTIDIASKIGVPYDYQTVLFDNLDLKSLGVHTKQPTYNKIYNYYDFQYEDVVSAIISDGYTDERALPSIYDFLYLPVQENVRAFVKIPSIPLEETNLAGINRYLDTFSGIYSKLDEEQVSNETIDLIVNNQFTGVGAKWATEYNNSLKGLGARVPDAPAVDPTNKQILLQGLNLLAGDEVVLEDKKNKSNPAWVNQLKTGVYFSKKSLNVFNEALDYDNKFPFLMKINIPTEDPGPLARLLDQVDLLDTINAYAASVTIPTEEGNTVYNNYYGAVINGVDSTNFNTLFDLKLPTFKILLKDEPTPALTLEEVYNSAQDTDDRNIIQQPVPGAGISEEKIWLSWKRRKIDEFAFANNLSPTDKIVVKVHPWKKTVAGETVLVYPPLSGPFANILGFAPGPILEIWAYDSDNLNKLHGGTTVSWVWHQGEVFAEQAETGHDSDSFSGYSYQHTQPSSVYDVSNTDIHPNSIYSERKYPNDLYLNTLVGNNLPNVFTYQEDGADVLTEKTTIQALLDKLKLSILNKKLKELLLEDGVFRTPLDIHDGEFAHQETLMYEIAKYGISEEGEYYIQSIFLPITDQSELSYYDTQVVPYRDYFYKIFVHKAIVGTEYKLVKHDSTMDFKWYDLATQANESMFVEFKYEAEPFIQMIRVPYYNTDAVNISTDAVNFSRIEDKPPLPPQVDFVPYRNINDQILILLNNSIGEIEQYPRPVYDDEWVFYDQAAIAQDRAPGEQLIFRSDDSSGRFQVFRTENLHSTYQGFGKDPTLRYVELDNIGVLNRDSTGYIDRIKPNTDYYYFVRFLDLHDKFSNPTVVYKLRMIADVGITPYLHLETLDLVEIQKKEYEEKFSAIKNVQKYLLIQPNDLQKILTTPTVSDNSVLVDKNWNSLPVEMGDPNGNSVFGRKFKFRITSKQTGRKIDINLTVKDPENIINQ